MASASSDRTALVWDMRGNEVGKYVANDGLTSIAFFPDQHHLAFGSLDNTVGIIDWRTGSLVENLLGHIDSCFGVDVLPKSRKIVSAGLDKSVLVWSTHKLVEDFSPQTDFGYSIDKILTGHEVCAEASPLLHANNIRTLSFQSRRQKTTGG